MIGNVEQLDNELVSVDTNSAEGMEKIAEARRLLPIHYQALMDAIGGEVGEDLDTSRLPDPIRKLTELFIKEVPHLGKLTNAAVANMVYANVFGRLRVHIRDDIVAKGVKLPCNLLTVATSASGSGKDASLVMGLSIMKPAIDATMEAMMIESELKAKNIATKKNKEAQVKNGVKDDDIVDSSDGWEQYLMLPIKGDVKSSTAEGLTKELTILAKNRYGNIFFKVSELGSSLALDPAFDRMLQLFAELYDLGTADQTLVKTQELKTESLEASIAPSALMHTSPAPLLADQKLTLKLKTVFATYFGRRATVVHNTLNDATKGVDLTDDMEEQIEAMLNGKFKNVEEMEVIGESCLVATNRIINGQDLDRVELSDGARKLYLRYYILNKNYRFLAYMKDPDFQESALLSEIINRFWKAVKLAGLWAVASNTSVISTKIMAQAIYFTELTGKGLRNLLKEIDMETHERFVNAISSGDIVRTVRFDILIKMGYIFKATKESINTLLVAVNSALQGSVVCTANYEKSIVEIKTIEKATEKYGTSTVKFNPTDSKDYRKDKSYKGFKYVNHKLSDLVTMLKGDFAYSPFKYRDGRRSNDNCEGSIQYIVLDVDESELPMDILHETYLSGTSHIIATTSDSTNLHKFRILLPIAQKLGTDPIVFRYIVNRIAEELMVKIDPQSGTLSQIYFSYSGGTILDNLKESIPAMDISGFLADAAINKQSIPDYGAKLSPAAKKKLSGSILHDFESEMKFAINAREGMGSVSLWQAGKKCQSAGIDFTGIETIIHRIHSTWKNQMEMSRVQAIVNQFR